MKNVEGILIAIMFKEPLDNSFSFFNITAKFKDEFESLFSKVEPIPIVPAGESAPPEIPRYILQANGDKKGEFSFAPLRLDFRFVEIKKYSNDYLKNKLDSIQSILNDFELKEFRIGIVSSGTIESKEDDPFLKRHIRIESLSESKEIQFSYRNIINESDYNLNEWMRYRTLTNSTITNFEYDVNTIDSISKGMINSFGDIATQKIGEFIES